MERQRMWGERQICIDACADFKGVVVINAVIDGSEWMEGSHRHIHARSEDRRIPNTFTTSYIVIRVQANRTVLQNYHYAFGTSCTLSTIRRRLKLVRRVFLTTEQPKMTIQRNHQILRCRDGPHPRNSGPKTTGEFQVERLFETNLRYKSSSSVITWNKSYYLTVT